MKRGLQALALIWMHSALALGAGSLECSSAPGVGKYSAWRTAAAQTLARRDDARSLATAAALCFVASGSKVRADPAAAKTAVDLAARASELDPRNPSMGWLRLQLCANSAGCDIREAATTLRWVDADNGAVWLPTLAAVQKDKDPAEIDRILSDMAEGSRFDFYWNPTVVLLFDTLKRANGDLPPHYLPSDLARLSEVMLVAGEEIVPPLSAVMSACRDPVSAERRESCLRLAKVMQKADTVAAQIAGLHIEKHLVPADGKEAHAVAERRRVLEWRVASANREEGPVLPWLKNAMARQRIAEMRAAPREEDVDIAILRQRRLPLEPPVERP
ncbi:MAG: hypothetical protein ABSG30_10435 [Steroidobacteraceae bacterium]|jgi:hypothetical protein